MGKNGVTLQKGVVLLLKLRCLPKMIPAAFSLHLKYHLPKFNKGVGYLAEVIEKFSIFEWTIPKKL